MHPTSWTATHDRLLADAEAAVSEPSDAEIERVWLRVAAGFLATTSATSAGFWQPQAPPQRVFGRQ